MYKLLRSGCVTLIGVGGSIPPDTDNLDWLVYLAWLAQGNTPLPFDPLPPPTQDQLDAVAANQYAKLVALKNMTPAQVSAWVDANVTNLATAQDAIKTLAIAVGILARRI